MFMHHGRGRRGGLGLLMLFGQMQRMGFGNIPPITLGTIGANVVLFLGLFRKLDFPLRMVCLNYGAVVMGGQWSRLLWSSLFHADEWHLCYNMTSFLWKGYHLERGMGPERFLALLALLLVLTPAVYLAIIWTALNVFAHDLWGVASECAVGFSGIIFALKVLTTHNSEHMHDVFYGLFSVQGKYVVWAELLFIHLFFPGTSLLGHLSGILAGMLYVHNVLDPVVGLFEAASAAIVRTVQQAIGAGPHHYHRDHRDYNYNDDDDTPPPAGYPGGPRDDYARRQAAEAAARRQRY